MNTRTWQSPEWLKAAPEITNSAFHRAVSKWSQFRFHTWPSSEDTLPRQCSQRPILSRGRKKNILLISLKHPEQLPASLITSPGSPWPKEHQNQQGLLVLVLSMTVFEAGTGLQKAQCCNSFKVVPFALREQQSPPNSHLSTRKRG